MGSTGVGAGTRAGAGTGAGAGAGAGIGAGAGAGAVRLVKVLVPVCVFAGALDGLLFGTPVVCGVAMKLLQIIGASVLCYFNLGYLAGWLAGWLGN